MRRLAPFLFLLLLASGASASATHPYDRQPPPTIYWMLAQAVPSPEVGFGGERAAFGVRWQLTPLLYSWGIYHKLSPYRFFVVEPGTRNAGSIALRVAPEYLSTAASGSEWGVWVGVRSTFPLVEHGERLAASIGAAALLRRGQVYPALEAGAEIAFGVVGLFVTYAPSFDEAPCIVTLRVRYF